MSKENKVSFKRMDHGSIEDYKLLHSLETEYIKGLPDRILKALLRLDDTLAGYQVTRLEHSLQSATRAEADGADGAVLRQCGWALSTSGHAERGELLRHQHARRAAEAMAHQMRAPLAVLPRGVNRPRGWQHSPG